MTDELERSRRAFEAAVDRGLANRPRPAAGGKGSPAALVTIGVVSTLTLGLTALLLGGGLLLVPALIPLATVLAVLGARAAARSPNPPP